MSDPVEAQRAILTGTPTWSATPADYSSMRGVSLKPDGTGIVYYGYGQTLYAQIDCLYVVASSGTIRFEYFNSLKPKQFPFVANETNRFRGVTFSLTEVETKVRESVTGFGFGFTWTLEFNEPPYPIGLNFPYAVPRVFFGYREKIGDRNTSMT